MRGKDSRAVNNEVRTLFLRTILGVCGVRSVAELPPGVQAVLKADDDLRRLARADWSRFDFDTFLRAGDDGGTDEQIAQIPEPFRLHARITASIRFELNAAPARQNVHA